MRNLFRLAQNQLDSSMWQDKNSKLKMADTAYSSYPRTEK